MSNIVEFAFENKEVRITDRNGKNWFVLRDVLSAMNSKTKRQEAVETVEDGLGNEVVKSLPLQTAGGIQDTLIISEPAVTYLLARSRTQKSKMLNRFIHTTIIPSARKMAEIIKALNEFEVPDDLPDMYVYVMREKQTGNLKIGISKDPEERLKQLQIGNSSDLELVTYKKAENRFRDEKVLHLGAMAYHIRGEWFNECAMEVMQ